MVVVNLTGFNYSVKMLNGKDLVIPFFSPPKPVNIPDECNGKFGDGIKVLRLPAQQKPVTKVEEKKVTKTKEKIVKRKDKPLAGVKIEKNRREKLLKEFKMKRENK